MSEFWVSKKKYFCKYCDIYIADDAPSRQLHENGLRHQGNRDRYIRSLYKGKEQKKRDSEQEKREMAMVEKAALAAFADDVSSGRVKPGPSTIPSAPVASSSSQPASAVQRPSNPYANYSTAESLGYTDPDAERQAAELAARQNEGTAGQWQVVALHNSIPPKEPDSDGEEESAAKTLKREAEEALETEESRQFKLRKKSAATGLGQIYDPGIIAIVPRLKKEESNGAPPLPAIPSHIVPASSEPIRTSNGPKWKKTEWSQPAVEPPAKAEPVKTELVDELPAASSLDAVNSDEPLKKEESVDLVTVPPVATTFKKRKVPQGRRQA